MRVTGGEFRGRHLEAPKGPQVRSTMDHVRQALFNLLGDASGKKVLDLFSGSGALGIEALSRGATQVTLVDRSSFCVRTIQRNLESVSRYQGQSPFGDSPLTQSPHRVIRLDALKAIRQFREKGAEFDWVLLDPPYEQNWATKLLKALSDCAIVPLSGLVVLEHDKREIVPAQVQGKETQLFLQRSAQYGDTTLTFFQRR